MIYLYADTYWNDPWVYGSSAAWAQFHIEQIFIGFPIELMFIVELVASLGETSQRPVGG